MSDDPYAKVALSVIRLVAVALVMASAFLYSADLYLYLSHRPVSGAGAMIGKGIPGMLGLILFCASRSLAERFTDNFD